MKAFTDYPIVELGDIAGEEAPVREVEILSYDGNKYCEVLVEGVILEIKSGYLYLEPGRVTEVPCFMHDELVKLPGAALLRKDQQMIYDCLKKKYEGAEKNLKDDPERYGGEEYIKGFMSGLVAGMALIDPNLRSICMGDKK